MNGRLVDFSLDPAITYLNHASFGCPTRAGLDRAEARRRRIERDTAVALGPELDEELVSQAEAVEAAIGAAPGSVALVENTTAGAAALWASLPWSTDTRVFVLDVEYESIVRGLQVACARLGATLVVSHLPLPATEESVLAALVQVNPAPTVVVMSAVTSSTALVMPIRAVANWCAENGARLLVDGAHVVGHMPLNVEALGAAAVFGSLHKWLPVPRSVGFLWLEPALADVVRPAEVSLRWNSPSLADRFGWRGTWDPAAAWGVESALGEHATWEQAGDLAHATLVADEISRSLVNAGLTETAGEGMAPPRLRAFLVPRVDVNDLRGSLAESSVRAWTGRAANGVTIVRIATHIYNEPDDATPVLEALRRVLDRA